MGSVEVQEMVNVYMGDLFQGIVSLTDPRMVTKEYVKKKRLQHRFRKLLELDNLSEEEKEDMINDMIAVLPEVTTKEAYIEAQKRILGILSEYLSDTLKEMEELLKKLDRNEVKSALRITQRRQKHILISMRENLAEIILNDPKEELLVTDQALALAIRLYDRMLEKPDDVGKSLFLLVLLLRILGISKDVFSYDILYEDLAEIAPELDTEGEEIPTPIFELLSS